jgi:hypothetical protein
MLLASLMHSALKYTQEKKLFFEYRVWKSYRILMSAHFETRLWIWERSSKPKFFLFCIWCRFCKISVNIPVTMKLLYCSTCVWLWCYRIIALLSSPLFVLIQIISLQYITNMATTNTFSFISKKRAQNKKFYFPLTSKLTQWRKG